MKKLRPIVVRQKYETAIKKKIARELYDRLFAPIFTILEGFPKAAQKKNAGPTDAIKKAIHEGSLIYENDQFSGRYSSQIVKALKAMGAKWTPFKKTYRIDPDKIPADIRGEISKARMKGVEAVDKINKVLADAATVTPEVDFSKETVATLDDLHGQLKSTTAKDMEIPLAWEGYVSEKLTREYSENLNLYIKDWYAEEILRLRKQVQANAIQGFRASNLVKGIQSEYGVSKNKAKFLARQETGLLVSKYREGTYTSMGMETYQWSTSMDVRVRPNHRAMNGKTCRWDDPNVYLVGKEWVSRDRIGGVKLHPGEDFGCRCLAIPLLNEKELNIK